LREDDLILEEAEAYEEKDGSQGDGRIFYKLSKEGEAEVARIEKQENKGRKKEMLEKAKPLTLKELERQVALIQKEYDIKRLRN